MTKQELEQLIIETNRQGYAVPCVLNGGGFSWVSDWEDGIKQTGRSLSDDEEYDDEIEVLEKGEEYEDFKYFLSEEEYNDEDLAFVRVAHNTGYGQENFDYQFGIYNNL